MLASDLNNPQFQGARNPDAALHIIFYVRPVVNQYQSEKQGREVVENVDYIKISTPGDKSSVIDAPVREDHKKRFPLQWQAYKNRIGGEAMISGTPLTEWPRITPEQADELRALKFFSVEAIASAGDAQLQGIGMIAGQSVFSFRDDARRFLAIADAETKSGEADRQLAAAREQIERDREQLAKDREESLVQFQQMRQQLQDQFEQLRVMQEQKPTSFTAPEQKKRGRKPNVQTQEAEALGELHVESESSTSSEASQ
jgi:hypothetical protein